MSDWWTERRQNQQLSDLESEMAYARSETSNLRSQLSQIQGSLQSRVDSLSRAFDAFVELSDLRHETAGFLAEAELRRYATRILSAMASGTELPPPGEPVPQYWLEPALVALISLHSGTPDEEALSTAMKLDRRRTSTFLALASAALGLRHEVRTDWLDAAFGAPGEDGNLTRVQRVLWTTAARGGFGADGLDLIVKRLQPFVPAEGAWLTRLASRGSSSVAKRGPQLKATLEQDEARKELSRVRSGIESIVGNIAAREPDPSLTYPEDRKTDAVPDTAEQRTKPSRRGAVREPDENTLAGLLRLLISEGSEPERETLARIAVLRARVTGVAENAETLADSAGWVDKLLADDLALDAEPHLSAAALRIIAPTVLPGVEALAHKADRPAPAQVVVDSGPHQITVRPDGPDQLELSAVTSAIGSGAGTATVQERAVPFGLMAGGALVAVGLGLALHWFWIVVGVVIVAFGLNSYVKLRGALAADRQRAEGEIANVNERCSTAATALSDYVANTDERRTAITSDLTEIRNQLSA